MYDLVISSIGASHRFFSRSTDPNIIGFAFTKLIKTKPDFRFLTISAFIIDYVKAFCVLKIIHKISAIASPSTKRLTF